MSPTRVLYREQSTDGYAQLTSVLPHGPTCDLIGHSGSRLLDEGTREQKTRFHHDRYSPKPLPSSGYH